jgi:hypothetical protein
VLLPLQMTIASRITTCTWGGPRRPGSIANDRGAAATYSSAMAGAMRPKV